MFIVRAMMTGVFIATSIGGVFGSQPVINPTTYREFRSQVQNAIKNERFELYEPQVG